MNIIVLVKQTFDTEAKLVVKDGKIDDTGVNLIMNPYDEFAVEEAIRIKEKLGTGNVVAVALGGPKAQDALRHALAMGADSAVLLSDAAFSGDATTVAAALSKAIEGMQYDLILGGRISIDDQSSQVSARVAVNLGIPVVSSVTKLELADGKAICNREIEGGYEVVEVTLPALITAQKGLNEPRYPSLPNIMKAKKKELKTLGAGDIGFAGAEALTEVIEIAMPPARAAGQILSGEIAETAKKLVDLLKNEAKVI